MKTFYETLNFNPLPSNVEAPGFPVSEQTFPGRDIRGIVSSIEGYLIIRIAITIAPNVPPVVAFEEAFEVLIGEAAFSNDMKQYTGFLIRRGVEEMGGSFLKKGVKITRRSRYTRGSIYSL